MQAYKAETVESICRELAEKQSRCNGCMEADISSRVEATCPIHGRDWWDTVYHELDPRFDALRGAIDVEIDYDGSYEATGYTLRTDLGSMVRALSEGCRFGITRLFYHVGERQWWCSLAHTPDHHVAADTPELVVAKALKVATQ